MRRWQAIAILQAQQDLGTIEAETFAEAEELAWEMVRGPVQLCAECDDIATGIEVTEMDMQEEQ